MAPMKRKIPTSANYGSQSKKLKKETPENVKLPQANRSKIAEVETDSDPIIESDTASHSGDDDGTSWPSDEDLGPESIGAHIERGEDGRANETAPEPNSTAASTKSMKLKSLDNNVAASNSRESHAKQRATAQERKSAKPNADSIARSKKLWERLRRKSHVPPEERKQLVAELFDIITGRVKEFVFKHDSVRVIQTALKYANLDQRKRIAKELKGEYKTLAESKYAKFLIGKILVHGDEETRDLVVPEFYGHVRRMIKHPEASWILDDVYRGAATPLQKAVLLREWYGAEFALFQSVGQEPVSADLKKILAENPEKKKPILRSLHELINLLIQKKTTGFTILHDAMLQYFLGLLPGSEEAVDFTELLKGDEEGDLLKNLAFTKSGAHLVCLTLASASAKDRKLILRPFKGTIQMMAYDAYAHQILLTAYDVIDDTILTSKSIFPELVGKETSSESVQQELMTAVTNLNARVPLLYLFSGKSKAILSNDDMKMLDEVHRIRLTTSKKDPETRRKELASHLCPSLLALIARHAQELVSTSFGCQFISEVLLSAPSDRGDAVAAIASLVSKDQETRDLLNTPAAGRMLKTLVLGGRYNPATKKIDPVDPPLGFHEVFYSNIAENLIEWATGVNSFVIVGLIEAPGFSKVAQLKEGLARGSARLIEAAGSGDVMKHAKSKKGRATDDDGTEQPAKGNAGARILIEKLDG